MIEEIKKPKETYIEWAKKRALTFVSQGDFKNALLSIMSDINKDKPRPEIQKEITNAAVIKLLNNPNLTEQEVRDFITGFN